MRSNGLNSIAVSLTDASVAALAIALTVVIPLPAQADFADGVAVSGLSAAVPQVAIDANGDALIVWRQYDGSGRYRIQARAHSATGVLGPKLELSQAQPARPNLNPPRVAITPNGDALVVWRYDDGANPQIQIRAHSAAGALGPIETISDEKTPWNPQVAIKADGDALVVWLHVRDGKHRILTRARSAGGVLGPIETLVKAGDQEFIDGDSISVAMTAGGDALVVWNHWKKDGRPQIRGRWRPATGQPGPLLKFSTTQTVADPRVAISPSGAALIVWERFDGAGSDIQGRWRFADGVLGPQLKLSRKNTLGAYHPHIAIAPDGDALIAWIGRDEANYQVQARAFFATGALGRIQTLSEGRGTLLMPLVAIDAGGNGVVLWYGRNKLRARTRSAAGTLGPIQNLLSARKPDNDHPTGLAMNADGKALAVWLRPGSYQVWAATGP